MLKIAFVLIHSSAAVFPRSPMENMFVNWYMNRIWIFYWNRHMLLYSYWHQLFHGYWYNLLYWIRHLLFDWNRYSFHDRYRDRLGYWNLNRIWLSNGYCYRMRHRNCHGLCHWNSYISRKNNDLLHLLIIILFFSLGLLSIEYWVKEKIQCCLRERIISFRLLHLR